MTDYILEMMKIQYNLTVTTAEKNLLRKEIKNMFSGNNDLQIYKDFFEWAGKPEMFKMRKNRMLEYADMDPQETTADWINERRENENLPDIRFAKMTGKIRDDLLAVETQYDCIVVDSGGHDTATMRFAMAAATHILIPFRPKRRDLKLLPKMEEILDLIKPVNPDAKVAAVINQAPTLPKTLIYPCLHR
jgi:hypothetical protein